MSYLRTFLPWIVVLVLPPASWQWAALAALVVAIGLIVFQLGAGAGVDTLIMELGSAAFFVVLAAIAFADPFSPVHDYSAALSSAALAAVAGISLAVGRPFTLGIAKRTTPREFWELRPFVRANVVITAVWAAAFAISAVLLAATTYAGDTRSLPAILIQIAGFVVPAVFTIRYVAAIRAKNPTPTP
ncbi:MAG: hypothetical protein JOZ47_06845 [Kutzneria sp.]|nr:hypothetical protein [Kutzneria sp.]MBV9844772.1 hypothetical protein [Kutzneria sp.]